MLPLVAIVGRPNVGKSTLFNRILGQRKAIVEDRPGVTRDRNYADVSRYQKPFTLVDTGGFEPESQEPMLVQMRRQSESAVEQADVILYLMDARDGLTPADEEVAARLRQVEKPVLYVVNKVDGERQELMAAEFYALGVGELETVSAEHGRGVGDLVDRLMDYLPDTLSQEAEARGECRLAVVGRPNVGKSSLVNKLLGFERVVATPVAGTTRDSVDTPLEHDGQRFLLIDTAGIRRRGKVREQLESSSVLQALRSMDRAHVVFMVVDASEGVTEQDLHIAGYASEKGRAIVLIVNKWDMVEKDHRTMKEATEELRHKFKFLPYMPILFVSAKTGQRVQKILGLAKEVMEEYNRQVGTAEINRALSEATLRNEPPMYRGRRLKFYYATQTAVRPPTFVLFANSSEGIHFSYQRYLINQFRESLGFNRVPIRLNFKDRK